MFACRPQPNDDVITEISAELASAMPSSSA